MPVTTESKALPERKAVLWVTRAISYLVYAYLLVVEIILIIGFFLLLFGANPSAGFTQWAYRNLDRVMAPFRGIFTQIEIGTTSANVESVFDTSVVFAMIIYGIVALLLSVLIGWLTHRLHQIHTVEEERKRQEILDQQAAEATARLEASIAAATNDYSPVDPTDPTMPIAAPPTSQPPPPPTAPGR
ncbi:MAG: hypothetical protein WBP59_00770 [Ilumatobacteraceae bacterium]